MGEIAEKMRVKASVASVMIDRLVKNGFAERRYGESDRRAVLVSITQKGKEELARCGAARREVVKRRFLGLEEGEIEAFLETFEKIARHSGESEREGSNSDRD